MAKYIQDQALQTILPSMRTSVGLSLLDWQLSTHVLPMQWILTLHQPSFFHQDDPIIKSHHLFDQIPSLNSSQLTPCPATKLIILPSTTQMPGYHTDITRTFQQQPSSLRSSPLLLSFTVWLPAVVGVGTLYHSSLVAFVRVPQSQQSTDNKDLTVISTVEFVGYIGRAISASDIWALGPYIVQSLLLLLAPALFAASIYMVLGKIVRFVDGERYSLIPLKWLTKVFVAGDVLSFLLQMAGRTNSCRLSIRAYLLTRV